MVCDLRVTVGLPAFKQVNCNLGCGADSGFCHYFLLSVTL